ncbi:MAG: carbamoyltransferase HypF [Actinomycetota bacterium]|nr:carbamoyltransferase HypF [Actinomycetota bacterium]
MGRERIVYTRGRPVRRRIRVTGVVQGVGFRPFVFGLATELGLGGFVGNDAEGVFIEVEGATATLDGFTARLMKDAPPLARIESVVGAEIRPNGATDFEIVQSVGGSVGTALVSPDLSTCDDCLSELDDPGDRRYRYPFLNCTNCGPRFTITLRTPYDRPDTTMAAFEMCEACRTEYENPVDRRFHAQPNACERCGPRVWVESADGAVVESDPIEAVRASIAAGEVVAIKGVGGFHLSCDATSDQAVKRLRERKRRADQPFALMVRDVATAERLVHLTTEELRLLTSRERPIVLARARDDGAVSSLVAPGNRMLGVMLPYTPLHHLLLEPGDVWVMTSGNLSSEPIVTGNEEARSALGGIADLFCLHDRDIHVPCDDSVVRILDGVELPVRRSRGYAPYPVALPFDVSPILAVGGELKATFCLADDQQAFMSQHIGDMENLETLDAFSRAVAHMEGLFRIKPEVIATDFHPGYLSTRWAERVAGDRAVIHVQHHHAHIASVMAENGVMAPVIGFSFDGTGFGPDGTVWGGEVFIGDYDSMERVARLRPVPLPGGDAGVERPYRMALAHLYAAGLEWRSDLPPVTACDPIELEVLRTQLERELNTIPTSSMGRLFDAVSSLAGVRQEVTYEAQAAIEFETLLGSSNSVEYRFGVEPEGDLIEIDAGPLVGAVVDDVRSGMPQGEIAARFHQGVISMIVEVAEILRSAHGLETVGLSGGVFQNVRIAGGAAAALRQAKFNVLTHQLVPPNDGGLALGQAVIAARQVR